MTLEQEILSTCLCHKARMAARTITRSYDEALRPAGLRSTQMLVLVAIASDGAISITELAQSMGMDRSTLTRNLGPLQEEQLVEIGQEGWRRSRTLAITEKGRCRLREALPLWRQAQQNLKKALGDDQWPFIQHALDSLAHSDIAEMP